MRRCVCAPYNADFDGDEMNIHVPQVRRCTCWRSLGWLPGARFWAPLTRISLPIVGGHAPGRRRERYRCHATPDVCYVHSLCLLGHRRRRLGRRRTT